MGSHSPVPLATPQIPVIDFSDKTLKPGSSKWDEVKLDVRKALEDYGCFEASFNKVSAELYKSFVDAMEELFELPIETKERNASSKPYCGYISLNNYESLGIDDANNLDKVYDFMQLLWPHGNKSISETIHRFTEQLSELDVTVRRMIMESFGIEKYLDEHFNSTKCMLRMIKYAASPDADIEETKLGLGAHTDQTIISIVHQCQVEGLELLTKDEKWIKVKPSQDSFIVLAGDALFTLMNGRVMSSCHRVMMKAKKTRYSTALFSFPKPGVIVDTPEELVDEEHPRLFKPYIYDELIKFLKSEGGQKFYQIKSEAGRNAYAKLIVHDFAAV